MRHSLGTVPTVACTPDQLATPPCKRPARGTPLAKPTRAEITAAVLAFSSGGLDLIAELEGGEQVARIMHGTPMPTWPR